MVVESCKTGFPEGSSIVLSYFKESFQLLIGKKLEPIEISRSVQGYGLATVQNLWRIAGDDFEDPETSISFTNFKSIVLRAQWEFRAQKKTAGAIILKLLFLLVFW